MDQLQTTSHQATVQRRRGAAANLQSADNEALACRHPAVNASPCTLHDVGVREGQLDVLARRAMGYPPVQANPRSILSVADVREILALAW